MTSGGGITVLDRLLELALAPGFRLASACVIVLAISLFLSQYFSILGDMRRLEAQQMHPATAHTVPQVGYAVDTSPLRGTPGGKLLNRLNGRRVEASFVVMDRTLQSVREIALGSRTILLRNPLSSADTEALSHLVFYLKTTARPILCFVMEGA